MLKSSLTHDLRLRCLAPWGRNPRPWAYLPPPRGSSVGGRLPSTARYQQISLRATEVGPKLASEPRPAASPSFIRRLVDAEAANPLIATSLLPQIGLRCVTTWVATWQLSRCAHFARFKPRRFATEHRGRGVGVFEPQGRRIVRLSSGASHGVPHIKLFPSRQSAASADGSLHSLSVFSVASVANSCLWLRPSGRFALASLNRSPAH